jgi:hypothetical protein
VKGSVCDWQGVVQMETGGGGGGILEKRLLGNESEHFKFHR